MIEWDIYLKKVVNSTKEHLGTVVANSPKKAIELFFEPETIKIGPGNAILIVDRNSPSNIYEYRKGKVSKNVRFSIQLIFLILM